MTIQLDRSGKLIHEKLILADRAVFNDFVCAFFFRENAFKYFKYKLHIWSFIWLESAKNIRDLTSDCLFIREIRLKIFLLKHFLLIS